MSDDIALIQWGIWTRRGWHVLVFQVWDDVTDELMFRVKVRRPGIRRVIHADGATLGEALDAAARRMEARP